jgi:hypothetical protein
MAAFLKWNNPSAGSDIVELKEIDMGFQKICWMNWLFIKNKKMNPLAKV